MYLISIIGDIFGIIPVVNVFSDFLTAIALGVAGGATDVSIYSNEAIGGTLVAGLVKMIPGVSIVPAWTLRVYFAKKQKRQREQQSGK